MAQIRLFRDYRTNEFASNVISFLKPSFRYAIKTTQVTITWRDAIFHRIVANVKLFLTVLK